MSKKEDILHSALQLFAYEGFTATSTKRVAENAGVSEGLIFRHFVNKDGLLQAVLGLGEERVKMLYHDLLTEQDPLTIIRKTIAIPFEVPEKEYPFWRLQYKLKWELNLPPDEKLKPLEQTLTRAFKAIGTPNPERESQLLVILIDALGAEILKGSISSKKDTMEWLMIRYGV